MVVVAFAVVVSGAASAHVTPQPPAFARGASDVVVGFAVPNEVTGAAIVKLEILLPTDHPITGVHAGAKAGWTTSVEMTKLTKPVVTDDGEITEVVSTVTWTATGPGIQPNEFGMFRLLAGSLPSNAKSLTFKVLQTYSDGTVVRWIEPIVKGVPRPEHPAPVVKLTAKTKKR
jgi:uncharacterized protein YcnI